MKNKRHFTRVEDTAVVTYEKKSPGAGPNVGLRELPCWLINLSKGGARLRAEQNLPVDSPVDLNLKIQLEDPGNIEISLHGEIRWSQEDQPGGPYLLGLEFTNLSLQDQKTLEELIKE